MSLKISFLDLSIILAYLVGVVIFGIWMAGRQRDASDFTVGDRNIPWWAVLLSIVATETSTVTFLSIPGIAYKGDLTFLQLPMGYVLGRYLIVYLLLPLYFRGELFTAYQVLHQRFGGATKQAASLLFIITRSLADGLRLFLMSTVLKEITGAELWVAVVVTGMATIVYSYIGGIKAVVWTDVVQFCVYLAGALLAGAIILQRVPGGLNEVIAFAREHGKLRVFDFNWDLSSPTAFWENFARPYSFWAGLIGGAFVALGSHGSDQLMVQRYLCARSEKEAGRALATSGWVVLAQFALFLGLGLALACFFSHFPPERPFAKGDEVFARFIVQHLPVGVVGITLAAVFSAGLSGSLNSLASAALNDIYVPAFAPQATAAQQLWVTRWLTVLFGLIQIGVALFGERMQTNTIDGVMTIASFTIGIVLGVFFLAIASKRAGQPAALFALVGGMAGMTAVVFAPQIAKVWGYTLTAIAWPWYAVLGSLGTLSLGLLANAILQRQQTGEGA